MKLLMVFSQLLYNIEESSSSLSVLSSNSNTNNMEEDQGSVTQFSQERHSVDGKSNKSPSDQSKVSYSKKGKFFSNSDDPDTSKVSVYANFVEFSPTKC
jgi:outer membrane lipoprotein-sorting protein